MNFALESTRKGRKIFGNHFQTIILYYLNRVRSCYVVLNFYQQYSIYSFSYQSKVYKSHTKTYIHQNWTLNHTPKPNPNCHILSIKTKTATKAIHNIQSIRLCCVNQDTNLMNNEYILKKIQLEDSSEEVTKSTAVLACVADLAVIFLPPINYRFPHTLMIHLSTQIFVVKMLEWAINRMKKKSKRIREEEPKHFDILEVWTK